MMNTRKESIGFVGLGTMGSENVKHLLSSGFEVRVFDLDSTCLEQAEALGARVVGRAAETVEGSDLVFTCLPSNKVFTRVVEDELLPVAGEDQVFIALDTVIPEVIRGFAVRLREKGAWLIDAPVTGGQWGAAEASLRMFVGGDREVVDQVRPVLATIAAEDRIVYCGESGAGQVVKGVNQLKMGLENAAYLEAIAYGLLNGVRASTLTEAFSIGGINPDFKRLVQQANQIEQGEGEQIGVKFRELIYFIEQGKAVGFNLPIAETVYRICDAGERVTKDDHRAAPSYWHELVGDG
jgi:3-hydroxyisobutyrate dehydrogenase-like beta-hydroxyacid dehydrogenase